MTTPTNTASEKLLRIMTGFWLAQAVHVFCKLGIADLIASGVTSADELAEKTSCNADALNRLLRTLAGEGILHEKENQEFALNELSERFCSDAELGMAGAATMYGEEIYQAWGNFFDTVKTGKPAWEQVFGKSYFGYMEENPQAFSTFNRGMTELAATMYSNERVARALPLEKVKSIVDLGGGHGGLLLEIMKQHPEVSSTLFERPKVLEEARPLVEQAGFIERTSFVEGDFFKGVPAGGDAYLLKRVIHDWNDEASISLLRNCREVMQPGAKVFIIELVLPGPNERSFGKLIDLHMMTILHGRERTALEYQELLEQAELSFSRVIPTECALGIVEASR